MVDVYEQLPVNAFTRAQQIEEAAVIYIAGQGRAKGLELLQRALQLREQAGGPGSADASASPYWIALEAALLEHRKTAEHYARRALHAQTQRRGASTPMSVTTNSYSANY